MGIPSYFSYIIRNYPKIISNIKSTNILFQHLFLDCNSIIYDSVRGLENKNYDNDIIDCVIINEVIKKINEYIHEVKPTKTIFIAFDGVAPFAKMNQQRTRRYKSDIISKVLPNASFAERSSDATQNETNKWDTTQITPGTDFMNLLSKKITEYYNNSPVSKGRKIIVSTSDEAGEGEHKLFHFIREHDLKEDNVMIYGLDSDLFMLSIFHNEYYKNAYIFREAPDFLQSKILVEQSKTDSNINNNCYMIDIELLRKYILKEMGFSDPKRIYDYAFLCFFLGNDFLPHFPALNIRTHGIQTLLDIYNQCFKNKPDKFIVIMEKGIFKIHWNHLEPLLKQLSHLEHDLLLKEYSIREKYNKWNFDTKLEEKNIQNMPIMYRMDENYICPTENEWETRYYNILFPTCNDKKVITKNYFEGLEWVLTYYTGKCIDWKWNYKYHYGPLFYDLYKFSPSKNKIRINLNKGVLSDSLFDIKNTTPVLPLIQLAYVLPRNKLYLLPQRMKDFLLCNYSHLYPEKVKLQWAFNRYLWESHICLEEVPMSVLNEWEEFIIEKI